MYKYHSNSSSLPSHNHRLHSTDNQLHESPILQYIYYISNDNCTGCLIFFFSSSSYSLLGNITFVMLIKLIIWQSITPHNPRSGGSNFDLNGKLGRGYIICKHIFLLKRFPFINNDDVYIFKSDLNKMKSSISNFSYRLFYLKNMLYTRVQCI